MPSPESTLAEPRSDPWLHTVYQLAHSDTRWAKEQGWRVLNWTFVLLAALVPLAKLLLPHVPLWAFTLVGAALALLACIELCRLYQFADEARMRFVDIQSRVKLDSYLVGTQSSKGVYRFYLVVQLAAVVSGLVAVLLALRYLPGCACGVAA